MEPRPAGIFCPGPSVFPPEARSLLCAGDGNRHAHGSRPSDHTKTGIKHGATTAKVSATTIVVCRTILLKLSGCRPIDGNPVNTSGSE
jgi:hypothetical protein